MEEPLVGCPITGPAVHELVQVSHERHHARPPVLRLVNVQLAAPAVGQASALQTLVSDITDSLAQGGIRRLVLVNGHGGNYVLSNAVQEGNVGKSRMALFPERLDWDRAREDAGLSTTGHSDMHGGELETSILLHVDPQLVRPGQESADWLADERPHLLVLGMKGYTESGIIGRPSLATADKGQAVLDSLVKSFSAHPALLARGRPFFSPRTLSVRAGTGWL